MSCVLTEKKQNIMLRHSCFFVLLDLFLRYESRATYMTLGISYPVIMTITTWTFPKNCIISGHRNVHVNGFHLLPLNLLQCGRTTDRYLLVTCGKIIESKYILLTIFPSWHPLLHFLNIFFLCSKKPDGLKVPWIKFCSRHKPGAFKSGVHVFIKRGNETSQSKK